MNGPDAPRTAAPDPAVHAVTLVSADGATVQFDCRQGLTVNEAARDAGYRLRVVCTRGGCGACRATLLDGAVSYVGPVSITKTGGPMHRDHDFELLCRATPESDVVLRPGAGWTQRSHHPWSALPRMQRQEGTEPWQ